jgi:tetratricopeptide (TPR) repeat protein
MSTIMELEELNLRNPIHIGYYDPFNIFPLIESDFNSKLPLTNLHWKINNQKLQSIPLLPVKLVEEVPKTNSVIDESIYTRIMFVRFDHLDVYRSQVRPLIIEWLKNLVIKYKTEWVIVLFIPLSLRDKPSTLVKVSHFDKLNLDFGPEGKELAKLKYSSDIGRCFKIKEADTKLDKLESYNTLIHGIKSILLSSFTTKYYHYSLSMESATPFEKFITRLSLADLLNDIRLFQDSLNIYDELTQSVDSVFEPEEFSQEISLPQDYNNYKFETSIDTAAIRKSFRKNDKPSLFDMKCLLFINQSTVLQSLANFGKTISISAIYISSLYQKLIKFLNDLLIKFPQYDLNELIIAIIDNYLELPICQKLIEIDAQSSENSNYQLHEILEFKGELRLFQRSRYLEIGRKSGFVIKGMDEEISLDQKIPSTKLTYSPIVLVMNSLEGFFDYFESVTELVIEDFVKCGRSKSIDVLSIDLALLNYQKENYDEALMILQESFDFFIESGWNFMGGYLLEIYISCVEKSNLKDFKLLTIANLKLLANLCETKVSECVGINNFGIVKQQIQLESILKKIEDTAMQMSEAVTYPLEAFINLNQIPFIQSDDDSYKYYIDVNLQRKCDITFDIDEIRLFLTDLETNENQLFLASKQNLNNDRVRLFSTSFKLGTFTPVKIELTLNKNLKLVQDLYNEVKLDDTVVEANSSLITQKSSYNVDTYHMYQNSRKLWCELKNSHEIELGSTKMELYLHNGDLKVEDVTIEISSVSDGVKISDDSIVKVDVLESESMIMVKVPFTYNGDNKVVTMKAFIEYYCDGIQYSHTMVQDVDTTLTIAVTVQDTFREDFIYSRFQIGTPITKFPIRLISTMLTTKNENYKISLPNSCSDTMVTYAEQPASLIYRITPDCNYSIKSSDCLDLNIEYLCIREECEMQITDFISRKLGTELGKYMLLLKSLIVNQVVVDLEYFSVYKKIKISNLDELRNKSQEIVSRYIGDKSNLVKVKEVLNELFEIDTDFMIEDIQLPVNKLHIPVPMPSLDYLQIVDLSFPKKCQYLVGEPINTTVGVKTISKWSFNNATPITQFFQLSIQNEDSWLLSGLKRNSFSVQSNETNAFEFEIVLVPLNVGNLALPKVVIKPMGKSSKNLTVDVFSKNGLETVLVVPELESISFTL